MGGKSVKVFSDSKLVVGQVKGEFEAKDERMQGYLSQVKCLQSEFDSFNLLHIPRNDNAHADSLAMLATSLAQDLPRVILVEDLYKPTETKRETRKAGPSWMDSIIQLLREDILHEERIEVDKLE